MKSFLLVLLLLPVTLLGQRTRQDSVWLPFATFLGTWKGTGGGEPGIGTYDRSYRFVLEKRFIEARNRSVYPPSAKSPGGQVHEDLGFFSYDRLRHKFILRQFHVEGFVNEYVLDSTSADGRKMVFVSESIENIPAGWRASETYEIRSDNEFTETFRLGPPGKPLEPYSTVTLNRVR